MKRHPMKPELRAVHRIFVLLQPFPLELRQQILRWAETLAVPIGGDPEIPVLRKRDEEELL